MDTPRQSRDYAAWDSVPISSQGTHVARKALVQIAMVLVPVLSGIIMVTYGR
jgi:hypothetical protein